MQYLAALMRLVLLGLGIYVMYSAPVHTGPQCLTGTSIIIIAVYLCLQSKFGDTFTKCTLGSKKETPKKKGLFG